ncbi:MAG: HD domain-containing protein [Chloroflexota bacterium]
MITVEAARQYYVDSDAAHSFEHVLRVWHLAQRIGAEEGADLTILQAAALLHDVGRAEELRTGRSHALVGAERAREILANYTAEQVERVAEAIAQHRFRDPRAPSSLEAQVLFDADKLDALGAIGVARAYAAAGTMGQRLWAPVQEGYSDRPPHAGAGDLVAAGHTPVHEFRFKLVRLKDQMYTNAGRRLAVERHRFMVAFFEELEDEVKGRR